MALHEMVLAGFVEELTTVTARKVVAELRGKSAWIDQSGAPVYPDGSPLGRNRHCAAVRRRIRELPPEEWKCAKVGRKHLLSPEALAEELRRLMLPESRPVAKCSAPEEETVVMRIRDRIARRRAASGT